MVYKTLHGYILRELLRIFLLTASALTTLIAFGGTFRPLAKNGIEISQLLTIVVNMMPAMMAYTIPIAALFAAVLVYWRMSTDNELTACRASGISFLAIVAPALVLGLVVACTDLIFVNYVVPKYLRNVERAVMSDLGSLIVSTIGRQETYRNGPLVIYANSAVEVPTDDPQKNIVILNGAAGTRLKDGRPTQIGVVRIAKLTIQDLPDQDAVQITADLTDAEAFNPQTFRKVSGSVNLFSGLNGGPMLIPSQLKSKPKYLNLTQLSEIHDNPTKFAPIRELTDRIASAMVIAQKSALLYDQWTADLGKSPQVYTEGVVSGNETKSIKVYAPRAELSDDSVLSYLGTEGKQVRVEHYAGKTLETEYACDRVVVQVAFDEISGTGMSAALELSGNVMRTDRVHRIAPAPAGTVLLSGIEVTPPPMAATPPDPQTMLKTAMSSPPKTQLRKLADDTMDGVNKLYLTIASELHSRGSFSLSCLTLVMLGAGLGILMRGKNPLAVFVVGFVPAVFLVLLITAGRQIAEGSEKNAAVGIGLIWAGNVVLLMIVAAVYAKLLRN